LHFSKKILQITADIYPDKYNWVYHFKENCVNINFLQHHASIPQSQRKKKKKLKKFIGISLFCSVLAKNKPRLAICGVQELTF